RRPGGHEGRETAEKGALAMYRVKAFGLRLRQTHEPHGTDLESLSFDALNDSACEMPFQGIRLDDRQRSLGHPAIITGATSAIPSARRQNVTPMAFKMMGDPDVHKGAIEGDRPSDEQIGNPHGSGVDEE